MAAISRMKGAVTEAAAIQQKRRGEGVGGTRKVTKPSFFRVSNTESYPFHKPSSNCVLNSHHTIYSTLNKSKMSEMLEDEDNTVFRFEEHWQRLIFQVQKT